MASPGLFIVLAKITPDKEEAFNRWYNEIHMPAAIERLPGIRSGKRYRIEDERTLLADGKVAQHREYQYLAVYEFESYDVMQAALSSGKLDEFVKQYNDAFGVGGRHHIRAVEVKSFGKR